MKSVTAVENRQGRQWGVRLLGAAVLCILAMVLSGCTWQHPGETVREVNLRHERTLRLNNEMMLSDLDHFLMLDRPSRLTDKRIP